MKNVNFSSCLVSKGGKCHNNSPCSFSAPVGELGTMNGVLVKLFWLGATKSIELLKTEKQIKCTLFIYFSHTRDRSNSQSTVLGLTGTDFPAPVFPVLTDAAVAGFGQGLESADHPAQAQKQYCLQ